MTRPLSAALAVVCLASCAKIPGMNGPQAPSLAPSSNVFLRNSFDTDASSYVGRFVPEGMTRLDESDAMALGCSQHITTRFVDGGGVKYTEYLATSTEVGARLGIPVVASAKAGGSSQGLVRVEYTLTGKMIGEIEDPVAFNKCCTQRPDQCTTRYVGEFLQGTGSVYHMANRSANADIDVLTPKGQGAGELEHGTQWERAVEFPNPVYFAFKTAGTTHEQPTGTLCDDWNDDLPNHPRRDYVLGVSRKEAKTETAARNRALTNAANTAVMQGLIEYPDLDELDDPSVDWEPDKDLGVQDWCVELVRTDKGERYKAKVLAWVEKDGPNRTRPVRAY